jgi:predicted nucleotidyltransferase
VAGLDEREWDCLNRCCGMLSELLGERLVEVRMFGSAARGDMWPGHAPQHSDIDLLVITRGAVDEAEAESLLNETYLLYLECGRQLSPQFFAEERLRAPEDERTREFLASIEPDVAACGDRRRADCARNRAATVLRRRDRADSRAWRQAALGRPQDARDPAVHSPGVAGPRRWLPVPGLHLQEPAGRPPHRALGAWR